MRAPSLARVSADLIRVASVPMWGSVSAILKSGSAKSEIGTDTGNETGNTQTSKDARDGGTQVQRTRCEHDLDPAEGRAGRTGGIQNETRKEMLSLLTERSYSTRHYFPFYCAYYNIIHAPIVGARSKVRFSF